MSMRRVLDECGLVPVDGQRELGGLRAGGADSSEEVGPRRIPEPLSLAPLQFEHRARRRGPLDDVRAAPRIDAKAVRRFAGNVADRGRARPLGRLAARSRSPRSRRASCRRGARTRRLPRRSESPSRGRGRGSRRRSHRLSRHRRAASCSVVGCVSVVVVVGCVSVGAGGSVAVGTLPTGSAAASVPSTGPKRRSATRLAASTSRAAATTRSGLATLPALQPARLRPPSRRSAGRGTRRGGGRARRPGRQTRATALRFARS